jgi:hypothetical protein
MLIPDTPKATGDTIPGNLGCQYLVTAFFISIQNHPSRALLSNSPPRSHRSFTTPPISTMQERIKGGKLIFNTFPREYVVILTVKQ